MLCFLFLKIYVEIILTLPRRWFYFSTVFKKSRKTVRWRSYPINFLSAFVLFLITEFRYYYFGNQHTGIPGLWTQELDSGLWTLDAGLWTLNSERWTLDAGLWTLDSGHWTRDSGLWTLNARLWTSKL